MGKIVSATVAALVVLAVLAIPASARIDHHFSVITKQVAEHATPNGFRFREQLFATFNPSDQVGNDRVRCKDSGEKVKCRALVHLNGEVGGSGFLRVKGNVGRGDHRLNVVGGTGDFSGAAGKVVTRGHRLHLALVK